MAEQHRHHAEPHARRHRQVHAVTGLDRQRCVRVDHNGEQRQKKQRRLGVQPVSHKARSKGATRGALTHWQRRSNSRRVCRLGAQGLEAYVQQVRRGQPLERVKQHNRLRHNDPDTQQRIPHMQENRRTHAQRGKHARTSTVGHAFTHDHSKIRPRAGHSQQVNQGDSQKFCPIHARLHYKLFLLLGSTPYAFTRQHKRYS